MLESKRSRIEELSAFALVGLAIGKTITLANAATGAGGGRLLSAEQISRMAATYSPERLAREARLLGQALGRELDHPSENEPTPREVALERTIRDLRGALAHYAKPEEGWELVAHADTYDASGRLVPFTADEDALEDLGVKAGQ